MWGGGKVSLGENPNTKIDKHSSKNQPMNTQIQFMIQWTASEI